MKTITLELTDVEASLLEKSILGWISTGRLTNTDIQILQQALCLWLAMEKKRPQTYHIAELLVNELIEKLNQIFITNPGSS